MKNCVDIGTFGMPSCIKVVKQNLFDQNLTKKLYWHVSLENNLMCRVCLCYLAQQSGPGMHLMLIEGNLFHRCSVIYVKGLSLFKEGPSVLSIGKVSTCPLIKYPRKSCEDS